MVRYLTAAVRYLGPMGALMPREGCSGLKEKEHHTRKAARASPRTPGAGEEPPPVLGTARPGPANGQGDPYNSLVWRACRPLGAQMRDNVMGTSGSDAPLAGRSSSIEWTRDPRSPVRKRPHFALARAWRCVRHVTWRAECGGEIPAHTQ